MGACPLGDGTPHGDFATEGEAFAFAEQVNALHYGASAMESVSLSVPEALEKARDLWARHQLELANARNTDAKVRAMLTREGVPQDEISWMACNEEVTRSSVMDQAEYGDFVDLVQESGYRGRLFTRKRFTPATASSRPDFSL